MKIAITGGTGLIGQALVRQLSAAGHELIILTRRARPATDTATFVEWLTPGSTPELELEGVDVIVHLAGSSINDGRWTPARKQGILNSRIEGTRELVRIATALKQKPKLVISSSAIGIYGVDREQTFTEQSTLPPNEDFLGKVCEQWEREAEPIAALGIRLAMLRTGIVLANEGGAFPLMKLPYTFGAGGRIGSGKQWVSWIHIDDLVRMFTFIMDTPSLSGPVNGTAPTPVTMDTFGRTLGACMHRPHWAPAPAFLLRIALGEKSVLVLEGAHVLPEQALHHGFKFRYDTLEAALKQLLSTRKE